MKKKTEPSEDWPSALPVAVALDPPSIVVDAGVVLGTPADGEEALLFNVELEAPF